MPLNQNAAPEIPKEPREASVAEIAKLSPQDSAKALTAKLEDKFDGLDDLAKKQKGPNKEIADIAKQSVAARLELMKTLAA